MNVYNSTSTHQKTENFPTMCFAKSGITFKLSNGQQINNKFSDILVVGNGFDLFLGQKTKYSDFFNFIILYQILFFIKNSDLFPKITFSSYFPTEFRCKNSKLYDLIKIVDVYFETYGKGGENRYKKLKKAINTNFFKWLLILIFDNNYSFLFEKLELEIQLKIYNVSTSDNLREDLYELLSNYQKIIEKSLKNAEKTCNSWTDVEQFIEYVVLGNHDLQCKFDSIKGAFGDLQFLKDVPNKSSDIYKGLQSFCNEFSLYFTAAQKTNDISTNYNKWNQLVDFKNVSEIINKVYSDSLKVRSKKIIDNISFLYLKSIIDFNYTKTTDILVELYEANLKSNMDYNAPFIYHINGEIDSNNLIFGYGRNKNIEVSKECLCFEKFTQRVIKNTQFVDYKNLLADKYNVLIFGHSCSLADRDVIEKLLSSDKLGVAVIYCHDIPSLISISNNLQEILGQDRIETLLDYSEYIELVSRDPSYALSLSDDDPHLKNYDLFEHDFQKFHPILFFCVESQNDEFLKIRKSN